MEKSPLISIITITYNAAEVLNPTMDSVNSQTFGDYEHIIIDGASKDDTLLIARRFASARILSEPDRGLYDAMNKGLKMARGQYVIFLNAGDTFHSASTLEQYAKAASKGYDIIYGETVIVDSDRNIIGPRHLSVPDTLTRESFANGMLICHQAFMVKRSIAPDYDLRYRFSADYDWTIRCMEAGDERKFYNLRQITIDYLSDGLTDRNKLASLKERFRIMAKHYGTLPTTARHIGFLLRAAKRKLQ